MNFIKEFKIFITNGSVAEVGIGLVLGAAFSKLIDSLVSDILLPPIGLLMAKVNFTDLFINLSGKSYSTLAKAQEAGAPTINYGIFIMSIVRFFIVLFAVFLVVRQMNRLRKPNESPIASMTKKECPFCLTKIPTNASRCPNCTSELNKNNNQKKPKKRPTKINIS